MSADAYHPPTTSPRLETLDVLSIGMSLDVFRQGQVWKALQEQNAAQAEALHVGSILPMDPKKYPTSADDKDMAYEKRQADALELGLKNFLEKWPIPTVTVVRGWDPSTPNLRFTPEETRESLSVKVNDLRVPAGLHWHRIAICRMALSVTIRLKEYWRRCSVYSNATLTCQQCWCMRMKASVWRGRFPVEM